MLGDRWRLEQALQNSEDSVKLNTSFVERLNLTIRQGSAYLGRRTIYLSSAETASNDHLELLRCHYNFVRPHRALKFGREVRTVASDFFVAATASFRVLYVFVVMEIGTRRILHFNLTAHPTAEWTLQQFREVISGETPCEFVIHDRDSIYSRVLDSPLESMGVKVLKTPFRSPQANGFCERLIGRVGRGV